METSRHFNVCRVLANSKMQYALKKEKEVIKRHGGLDEYVIYAIF